MTIELSQAHELWPIVVMAIKVAVGGTVALPFVMWPLARRARRKAYGPGGGLR